MSRRVEGRKRGLRVNLRGVLTSYRSIEFVRLEYADGWGHDYGRGERFKAIKAEGKESLFRKEPSK